MTEKANFIATQKGYVKSISVDEDYITIPVIGIPFGNNDQLDLHNQYFDKSTDNGMLNEVLVYYNHNQFYPANDDVEELEKSAYLARAFKGRILGVARKAETTEEGVIYNIILDKREKYINAIKEMVEDGLLDISSGAKYRELDSQQLGRISKWHTVELSFTPSPANPNAGVLTKSILEKALQETIMIDEHATQLDVDAPNDESLIPDNVKSAIASITPVKTEETIVPELLAELNALKSQNEALISQMSDIETAVKSIQATLPYMIKSFGEIFRQEANKSSFEIQAGKTTHAVAPKPPAESTQRPVFGGTAGFILKAPGRQ